MNMYYCTMTELYKMSFVFYHIINEKGIKHTEVPTVCVSVYSNSTNPSLIHADEISQHCRGSQTS